jgi:hypothetical protein
MIAKTITPKDRAANYNDWMAYLSARSKQISGYKNQDSCIWDKNTYIPKDKKK